MPCHDITLNLPGFTIKKTSGYNPIIHDICYHRRPRCPHCKSKNLRKKDHFQRLIEHEMVGFRRVLLRFLVNKYHCRTCKKYFRQRFEGILPWQRSTEPLKRQVYNLHIRGISRKDLAEQLCKSDGTISRFYDHVYHLQDKKRLSMRCPEILGIDEHFFSRNQGFATTFCDLKKHRIFDVCKGRYEIDLQEYLQSMQGRERVRVVCMDLSSSYRSLVRKYFPNAKIVADRFHVIRLVLHRMLKTCQNIDEGLKKQHGTSRLLRKHQKNLTKEQTEKLQKYLQNRPEIDAIDRFKEKIMQLLLHKKQTKKQCRKLIPEFLQAIEELKFSGFEQCQKLAKTLQNWEEEIVRM